MTIERLFQISDFRRPAVSAFNRRCSLIFLILVVLATSAPFYSVKAAPAGTVVRGDLGGEITWTRLGSPYQIDVSVNVLPGARLTIEPGVVIQTADISSTNYNFDVAGTLIARGTVTEPIRFVTTSEGWSGVNIMGTVEHFNTGSVLEYVILDGGGYGDSGSGANLHLTDSEVTVRHCQFSNSSGDGILGDNGGSRSVAHVSDSSFTNNRGYAINFEDGNVNPVLSDLTATGNGAGVLYGGNFVAITGRGILTGTHTWEKMGLPYLLYNQISVEPTATLIISPGVQIYVTPGNDMLDVAGRLIAEGTDQQEIHIDPIAPAEGWSGLKIVGADAGHPSRGTSLNHVAITKGGYGDSCDLYLYDGEATVSNSHFSSSEDSGVCLDRGAWITMSNILLTDNLGYAIDVLNPDAYFSLSGLSATGNTTDSIAVRGGGIYGLHSWPNAGIDTYDIRGDLTIAADAAVNLAPGLKMRFEYGRNIGVTGAFTANGTVADPITFTSEISGAGQWAGITFQGTSGQPAEGFFRYVTLENGGYGGGSMVEVRDGRATFENCILRNCSADALHVISSSQVIRTGAAFTVPLKTEIHWSELYDIGAEAVNNDSLTVVDATHNWWGADSGPQAEDNPNGTGSAVSLLVDYRPYLGRAGLRYFFFLPITRK